jgi:hypothetical protein
MNKIVPSLLPHPDLRSNYDAADIVCLPPDNRNGRREKVICPVRPRLATESFVRNNMLPIEYLGKHGWKPQTYNEMLNLQT